MWCTELWFAQLVAPGGGGVYETALVPTWWRGAGGGRSGAEDEDLRGT